MSKVKSALLRAQPLAAALAGHVDVSVRVEAVLTGDDSETEFNWYGIARDEVDGKVIVQTSGLDDSALDAAMTLGDDLAEAIDDEMAQARTRMRHLDEAQDAFADALEGMDDK